MWKKEEREQKSCHRRSTDASTARSAYSQRDEPTTKVMSNHEYIHSLYHKDTSSYELPGGRNTAAFAIASFHFGKQLNRQSLSISVSSFRGSGSFE